MKRFFILAPLLLILIACICDPLPCHYGVDEIALQKAFVESADGDNITILFQDSLDGLGNDILHYPDAFQNGIVKASSGSVSEGAEGGNYSDTWIDDTSYYSSSDASAPLVVEMYLNFTMPSSVVDSLDVYVLQTVQGTGSVSAYDMYIYDSMESSWTDVDNLNLGTWGYASYSTTNSTYWTEDNKVLLKFYVSFSSGSSVALLLDYANCTIDYMTNADSLHFAESFYDVSEWSLSGGIEEPSTDGDIGSQGVEGDWSYDSIKTNSPNLPAGAYYATLAYRRNTSSGSCDFRPIFYAEDDLSGSSDASLGTLHPTSSWQYANVYLAQENAVESILFYSRATVDTAIEFDYLRVAPVDESGFSHDCSTVAGTDASSSDGDKINVTSSITLDLDTTTTGTLIDTTYYPTLEVNLAGGSGTISFEVYDSSSWITLGSGVTVAAQSFYYNLYDQDVEKIRLNASSWFTLDYTSISGIANHTLTFGSAITTTDYLYVDSGSLVSVCAEFTNRYHLLDSSVNPDINTNTFNVFNISTSTNTQWFREYVGSWQSWEVDTTRGELTPGTLQDYQLLIDGSTTISNIQFIQDSTAPDADIIATPVDPYDDESVTLSSIAFDTVEVYRVWYNPITYPTGFVDQDYEATEGQENYWSYSFSAGDLVAGDYCFKVIANDGANNSTLTQSNREYATVRFTVREAEIKLDPINLEGANPDETYSQVSFVSNKAGTWSVTEWTESDGSDAAETNTGTVVEGWNNIAWEKLDTTSTIVYFNMTVTNGTLSKVVPGLYAVAQTTFYVEPGWTHNGGEHSAEITVSGRISKLGTYTVYTTNTTGDLEETANGTLTALDFEITFTKTGPVGIWHSFAIKFTNGSQTAWANSTYYIWENDPDRPERGGASPEWWGDALWWTGIGIFILLIGVGIIVFKPQGGNLPNI